jgi:GNAT superfamily N-acetyltransferase
MEYFRKAELRDGTPCTLRSAEPEDAPDLCVLMRRTAEESEYLALSPEEVPAAEAERRFIAEIKDSAASAVICAFLYGRAAGSLLLRPVSQRKKCSHRAEVGLSVLQSCQGRGIGSLLMEAAVEAARRAGFLRLELAAAVSNRRAAALYRKFAFAPCGLLPCGIRLGSGKYEDLQIMSRSV